MAHLLIEHSITDFDTWQQAFEQFAQRRREAGVLQERILQPIDDPHHVLVDLEFASRDEARDFQRFLETEVWSSPRSAPALVGSPRARVADTAPVQSRE